MRGIWQGRDFAVNVEAPVASCNRSVGKCSIVPFVPFSVCQLLPTFCNSCTESFSLCILATASDGRDPTVEPSCTHNARPFDQRLELQAPVFLDELVPHKRRHAFPQPRAR